MSDIQLVNEGQGWDLALVDGDLVLFDETDDDVAVVAQRVTYTLMTWLGESVYDRRAGIPYLGTIFGGDPVPGVVGLLTQAILATEGVDSFIDEPVFALDDHRVLTVIISILTSYGAELRLDLAVSS